MTPYPVRSRIQEPETPSPVASQIACLHWRDGVGKPSPGDVCPELWGHHRWREGPRWGQRSVPEVGCRLKQLEGDHWGCSVRSLSWHVTARLCACFVCAWIISAGGAERRTQDSSVRTRHPPAAFLQLYGKRSLLMSPLLKKKPKNKTTTWSSQ